MSIALVTQRVAIDPAHGERRDALDQRWGAFLARCGMIAAPVPNRRDAALGLAAATLPTLIVLSGGNDLSAYGGDAPERDETEFALLDWARDNGVPVLGICRGMQVILHAFGTPLVRLEGHVATRHNVTGGGTEREVNSYHSFGALAVKCLTVDLRAADQSVEAVTHPQERIKGIMWHPERETVFSEQDVTLVRDLAGASR